MSPYRAPADTRVPDVLVCAGLDPSGGAGLIADVRVVSELGARPSGVVTALTVQNTTGVVSSHACDPEVVGDQLAFLMTDIEMKAVKIGMVGSAAIARAMANALHLSAAPVVWDPVMYPSRGEASLNDGSLEEAMTALRPHLTLVTPNKQELFLLTGLPTGTTVMAEVAGKALAKKLDTAVLVKGGHFSGTESTDMLFHDGNMEELRGPRIPGGEDVHGTGCALSSAIATYLAHGRELVDACQLAKQYVAKLIERPVHPGRGAAAVR
ncbi:MAG TPA: bifunctional hydroxymethylpyrimidine kinase/phosphomethylpyrimidine kinase [Kofleriaceae bacterium]|nr:bifunctional hydroxymethylpyrimidine kinase/phosphomethylpyrimidine kinase [Kofleriaceae bacterium]